MTKWRVQDVMITDVITASADARIADLVTLLTERQISAVPIVDDFGTVLGVVSWADLHPLIEISAPAEPPRWWQRRAAPRLSWPQGTAAGVMTGPPLTIRADASLPAAARLMHRHSVGRLLVTDAERRLRGIVSRSDLFKVHGRLDAVIRDDVMHQVLLDELGLRPGAVHVTVTDGVVTLTGRAEHRTAALAAGMAEQIPGVVDVVSRTRPDDDTAPAGSAEDPLRRHYLALDGHRRSMVAA